MIEKTCHECYPVENAFQENKFSEKNKLKYLTTSWFFTHLGIVYLNASYEQKGKRDGGQDFLSCSCHLKELFLVTDRNLNCQKPFMFLVLLNLKIYLFSWNKSWEIPSMHLIKCRFEIGILKTWKCWVLGLFFLEKLAVTKLFCCSVLLYSCTLQRKASMVLGILSGGRKGYCSTY